MRGSTKQLTDLLAARRVAALLLAVAALTWAVTTRADPAPDVLRQEAAKTVERAATLRGPESLALYERGAARYVELHRSSCDVAKTSGRPIDADACAELLDRAARAYDAAGLVAKAIVVRRVLVDPTNQMDHAPRARTAAYELAANYQALAAYDQAAEWYERYAADTTANDADKALSEAAALRLGLGSDDDVRRAIEDLATFQRSFRGTNTPHAASIALSLGTHYAAHEAWEKAALVVREALPSIDTVAGLDLRVQAHALLGRVHAMQNRGADALAEYGRVRDLWADPAAASQTVRGAYPSEDEAQVRRRLERALDAVGEALFSLAEASGKATVDGLAFPVYAGPNAPEDVRKHIATRVAEWVKKRTAATVQLQREYERIFQLKPEPPARWVTAASWRIAQTWGAFVAQFRGAPIPKAWTRPGCALHCGTSTELAWHEIRADYFARLDEAAETIKTGRAKPAFVACVRRAMGAHYFDDSARKCERWLGHTYPAEFRPIDELHAAPTLESRAPAAESPRGRQLR